MAQRLGLKTHAAKAAARQPREHRYWHKRLWCRKLIKRIINGMYGNSSDSATLFKGRHFDSSIIILCARCYITYKLSYRDLRDMMAERGIDLAHTTTLRWVQRYVPEFEKKWSFARPVGTSWRVDETYIRVRGQWKYLRDARIQEVRQCSNLSARAQGLCRRLAGEMPLRSAFTRRNPRRKSRMVQASV